MSKEEKKEAEEKAEALEIKNQALETALWSLGILQRGTRESPKTHLSNIQSAIEAGWTYENLNTTPAEIDFFKSGGSKKIFKIRLVIKANQLEDTYGKMGKGNTPITPEMIEKINLVYSKLFPRPPLTEEILTELKSLPEIFSIGEKDRPDMSSA